MIFIGEIADDNLYLRWKASKMYMTNTMIWFMHAFVVSIDDKSESYSTMTLKKNSTYQSYNDWSWISPVLLVVWSLAGFLLSHFIEFGQDARIKELASVFILTTFISEKTDSHSHVEPNIAHTFSASCLCLNVGETAVIQKSLLKFVQHIKTKLTSRFTDGATVPFTKSWSPIWSHYYLLAMFSCC